MKPRAYANLLGFLKASCTHASHVGRELPFLPFYVKEQPVGWLRPSFATELQRWPHIFEVSSSWVTLKCRPDTPAGRSAALDEVARALAKDGVIRGWRDELVSVAPHYGAPDLLRIERAATRHFGFLAYAAHLNGFTRRGGTVNTWVARRAADKSIDPGMLDNLVGGRIAAGMTVDETMRKEAWEEAGIAPALLESLYCVGAVRVEYTVPEGLHREILFVHDLWLPADFVPANQDGEVGEIRLMRNEDVLESLLAGEFTLDAGAVMIDALIRQGVPLPEDPQYLDLIRLLKP
jgi:8-oxo-dGTP pyrophosphatase MutT (NUDIX family)